MITNNILFFYIPQCKYNKDTISFAMHEYYMRIFVIIIIIIPYKCFFFKIY